MRTLLAPPPARAATAVLAVLALLLSAAPAAAADRVVFRTAGGDVVIRDVDSDQRRVVQVAADRLAWSPDGSQIAYTDAQGVWLMQAEEDAPAQLVVGDPGAWALDFSPDGSHLAYDRPDFGGAPSGIVVVPLSDDSVGDPREVTVPPADAVDVDPRWAPDGGSIAYRRVDHGTGYTDLEIVDLSADHPDGAPTERVLLDQSGYLTLSAPSWSPDGTSLFIEAIPRLGQVGTPRQLYRVDRYGGGIEGLVTGERFQPALPVVSPDGRHVAYVQVCSQDCTQDELQGSSEGGVWLLDTTTGGSTQVATTSGFERDLSWTADASQVVFESAQDDSGCHCDISELYAAPVGGDRKVRQLETFQFGPLAPAVSPGVTQRLSGPTRIQTAVAVSRATFDAADVVVLARSDAYADALAGAPLAGRDDGPLLLSPSTHLPGTVRREIQRLGASRVILLGDETALSVEVEQQMRDMA
ncbi:MAG TPA: cell wall-binding repeat-containing protein, partial [Euzebya sp.]|nr:cell wall-binding repeat-containing protein [Euzebya sp.]